MPQYQFYKQKSKIKKVITAAIPTAKDWRPDPRGYFLIRIKPAQRLIEVGFTTYKHEIVAKVVGENAQEIYHTIIKKKIISSLDHAAYLGKELYKAELALRHGLKYHQDFPLTISMIKEKIRLIRQM